jgi:hypothetical protein
LIVTGTSNGSSRRHQVPSGGKDLFIAELLPKLDIEVPAGIFMTDQSAHYNAISHVFYYPLFSSAGSTSLSIPPAKPREGADTDFGYTCLKSP